MYDVYFWTMPNGYKILLVAEEAGSPTRSNRSISAKASSSIRMRANAHMSVRLPPPNGSISLDDDEESPKASFGRSIAAQYLQPPG